MMLDEDLADIYGVGTKALKRAVRRNLDRFPSDFLAELSLEEANHLRCQIGTSKQSRGGVRVPSFAFTEQGVAMLSSILRCRRAVLANIAIMRAFVRLRNLVTAHAELSRILAELEMRYDSQFKVVFDAIRGLMEKPQEEPPAEVPVRRMGFRET